MILLLVILITPGCLVLGLLLIRYANWTRRHKKHRSIEDTRMLFHSFEREFDWENIQVWYRRRRFERSFKICKKRNS